MVLRSNDYDTSQTSYLKGSIPVRICSAAQLFTASVSRIGKKPCVSG
jgi:hypothetical protein